MSAPRPRDGDLSLARRVDQICTEFEAAWQAGPPPRLEDFLQRVDAADYASLLSELVLVELHYRRERGEQPRAEEYLERFPGVAAALWRPPVRPTSRSQLEPFPESEEVADMVTPRPQPNLSEPLHEPQSLTNTEHGPQSAESETVSPNPGPSDAAANYDFLAPPEAPDEIGRLGPYRVLGLLGAGGMGMVLRAADPQLVREVALKVILPQYAANPHARLRFLREARAIAAVDHLHVVPIFHVGEDHGVPYLVMPLLKGELLSKWLKRNPRPPVAELVRISREIAEGLAAAHTEHLVHRDVKPGNVWLEGDSRWVRLLDFGLARPDDTAETPAEPLTASGQFVGTVSYTSPEQADGHSVTAASDLFSLGVVLYQMATGVLPFTAPTMMAELTALATKDPEPPTNVAPELPPPLSELILRLLAKEPASRPPSAQAVAEELRQIEAGLTAVLQAVAAPVSADPHTTPATMTATLSRPRRRPALLWAVGGLLAIAAAGLVAQQQIRVSTPKGTLLIDSVDPNVEIVVKKNGAVIRDKTRDREILLEVGDYTIELREAKEGLKLNTDRFSIIRNGEETVKVRFEKPGPGKGKEAAFLPNDWQRRFAEWVLKQGGSVWPIGGASVSNLADLPPDAVGFGAFDFSLSNPEALSPHVALFLSALSPETMVRIRIHLESASWDDEALRRLIPQLPHKVNLCLWIAGPSSVTDAGLRHLLELKNLKGITMGELKVTDDGVGRLANLSNLDEIELATLPVTDTAINALLARGTCRVFNSNYTKATLECLPAILKNSALEQLSLRGIPIADSDLERLTSLKKLTVLGIGSAGLTNDGIQHLVALPDLWHLNLHDCQKIDDGIFEHLSRLKSLGQLGLALVKITDNGLQTVKTLPKLENLSLVGTQVTAAGVAKLRAELPKLKVEWDGDAKKQPEPLPADVKRKVAEWVLKQDQGSVYVEPGGWISRGSVLPEGDLQCSCFQFRLANPETLSPQVATWLKAIPIKFLGIHLQNASWSDNALGDLVTRLPRVSELGLNIRSPSTVTDQGLKHLLKFESLTLISLHEQKMSDDRVRELQKLPHLDRLFFGGMPITDKTVQALVRRGTFRELGLNYTQATEACLPAVLNNTALESLSLRGIPLRDDDLRKFAALKKLWALGIWGPHLRNESLRPLAELPSLSQLEIRECAHIDDNVFDQLSALKHLTDLILAGNAKITDTGLAKVKNLPKLTRLVLQDSTTITADGVTKLRASLPNLKVEWDRDAKKQP